MFGYAAAFLILIGGCCHVPRNEMPAGYRQACMDLADKHPKGKHGAGRVFRECLQLMFDANSKNLPPNAD